MEITAGELCYLLAKQHDIRALYDVASENLIRHAHLWRGQKMRSECLYVIDASKVALHDLVPQLPHGGVAILMNLSEKRPDSSFDRHAALPTAILAYEGGLEPEELYEDIVSLLIDLQSWDGRIKDACAASASIERVFDLAREQMSDLANIVDIDLNLIVGLPAEVIQGVTTGPAMRTAEGRWRLSDQAVEALLLDDDYSQAATQRDVFYYPYRPEKAQYICGNIFSGDECRARLVALCPHGIASFARKGMFALFGHVLEYVRQTLMRSWQATSAEPSDDALHRELRLALVDPAQVSVERLATASHQLGWRENHSFKVVRLRFFKGAYWQALVAYFCGQLELTIPGSRAAAHDNEIVWVCDLDLLEPGEEGRLPEHLTHTVREYACKAGISRRLEGIRQVSSGAVEARIALELGQLRDSHVWIYSFDDYLASYLYQCATAELPAQQLVHPGLARLARHDLEHGTEYLPTLRLYFSHEYNVTKAAQETYVHRTTFIRRLAAIPDIAGFDPHDPRTRLELTLSFWLLDCEKTLRQEQIPGKIPAATRSNL
ncbi:MAG: helix-turn-helix domain-containing protein [Coriobacteriales bacterium]|nr:helix-turn-helix domain-containing protein [Coriobacteriales bacterium]